MHLDMGHCFKGKQSMNLDCLECLDLSIYKEVQIRDSYTIFNSTTAGTIFMIFDFLLYSSEIWDNKFKNSSKLGNSRWRTQYDEFCDYDQILYKIGIWGFTWSEIMIPSSKIL